ncbi:MAG: outer membrane protein assembly factor BamE [Prevotella sp.]|nr:outer membrane protein assembly factor BamE [Prevotella sp.]
MIRTVIVITLVLALNSCASLFTPSVDYIELSSRIEAGMTQEEVKAVMGNYYFRSFSDNTERWEYRNRVYNASNVVVISFVDQRVVTMDSFQEVYQKIIEPKKED